jgi:DNA invertase Pin-like site-specific DNA recombinase
VNPNHLFLGDHRANALDMMAKGRNPTIEAKRNADGSLVNPPPIFTGDDHYMRRRPELVRKGVDIGTSKLTEAQVSEIYRRRMSGEAVRSIARAFDMDRATIGDICTGERWTHLLGVNGTPTKEQLLALPAARQPTLLSGDIVRSIRADFASGMMWIEVAEKYGVTKQTASEIRTRKTWAHVV